MTISAFDGLNENTFSNKVRNQLDEKKKNWSETLNIVVIGKVSSGKSSLINALLRLSRKQAIQTAKVGAKSGVTKKTNPILLDDKVLFIDSPGLDDIRKENSKITRDFLKHIDIGIFVVTGSSDASQKRNLDKLKNKCKSIFVVLNKIDEWDDLESSAIEDVINQWKTDLDIDKIYPTNTKGYDPQSTTSNMDIRGVYALRNDIEAFLQKGGKDLLLKRHMADKKPYANGIIASALASVATQSLLPGAALYITVTQTLAIASLYYLYTGKILSSKTIIATIPVFVTETPVSNLFLAVKSFFPPTGVLDFPATVVAVTSTLAMLASVNYIFYTGAELEQEKLLKEHFRNFHQKAKDFIVKLTLTKIEDLQYTLGSEKTISNFLY